MSQDKKWVSWPLLAAKGLGTLHILAGRTVLLDNIATVVV